MTFTAHCPHCNLTRSTQATLVTLYLDLGGTRHFAVWACVCGDVITPVPGKTVNPLRDAGAMVKRFRLPDEIDDVQRRRLDPLTEDDLIEFGLAVEATAVLA